MAPRPSSDARPRSGVSAVIPAYNYAAFLPKAIESVLQQKYSEYEIIVVDDGSTDNTAEVAAVYARAGGRVRYIHQENAGLSAARNTGIRNARFDYIGFLDADDEWLPDFLKRAMETFAQLPDDFAVVACRSIFIDASGATLNLKRLAPEQPQEITCRDILFRTHFFPSAVVARKSALVECGLFDETTDISEDRDMWLRIAARRRVMLLDSRLVRIRRHGSNLSSHAARMKLRTRRAINKAYRGRVVPRTNVIFWRRVFSFFHFQTAWTYRDENRRARAIGHMMLSIALWPWFVRPQRFNEPVLFRVRALLRFAREACARPLTGEEQVLTPGMEQPPSKA